MSSRRGVIRPQMRRWPDPQVGSAAAKRWLADPATRAAWLYHLARGQQERRARERRQRRQRALRQVA